MGEDHLKDRQPEAAPLKTEGDMDEGFLIDDGNRSVSSESSLSQITKPTLHNTSHHDKDGALTSGATGATTGSAASDDGSGSREGIGASLLVGLRETRWVNCSKLVLLIVLSICAMACAVTTFVYVRNDENSNYQEQVCMLYVCELLCIL